jgi:hypothetical protein
VVFRNPFVKSILIGAELNQFCWLANEITENPLKVSTGQ